jgi:hypothetical protein
MGEYLGGKERSNWWKNKLLMEVLPIVVFRNTVWPIKKA